jgi:crooked neck
VPRQKITDPDELAAYRSRKRKEFEDTIRMQPSHLGTWIKYAQWEESQSEFKRARSVYERALDINYQDKNTWLKYAEMEMRHKFINHARNVWDRAVTLLPRVDQFWYKYAYMEEIAGNLGAARQIFERWMKWEPDDNSWNSYVKFEVRADEIVRARGIHERYLDCHVTLRSYLKVARWEERQDQLKLARTIYERALHELPEDEKTEELFIMFAHFEERCRETERCRTIYKFALDNIPKALAQDLYQEFIQFEKKHGDRKGIEDVIIGKRRFQYEEQLRENPHDYDVWFDYIRLEESEKDSDKIREVYERAIANVPPVAEKRFWRRYIYLWINYALYEELEADDAERTRLIYRECLNVVPHGEFTFSKIWLYAAQFEVRQLDLEGARKLLGNAIGRCPKEKLFKGYIELELQLGNVDRCRMLYSKYLEYMPHNCYAWSKYAELESMVGESERCRAIYELAIGQPVLDMPEVLWKAFIDSEIAEEEFERTRELFERLIERTKHVKVWISFANFEETNGDPDNARAIFDRAYRHLKSEQLQDERVLLLETWFGFERGLEGKDGYDEAKLNDVQSKLPKKIKKRRMIQDENGGWRFRYRRSRHRHVIEYTDLCSRCIFVDATFVLVYDAGADAGWEEYYDYVFPDDEKAGTGMKLLELAHAWKNAKKRKAADAVDDE